ncbi:hypothetical protein V2J09_022065 [Rumex salicifolius]
MRQRRSSRSGFSGREVMDSRLHSVRQSYNGSRMLGQRRVTASRRRDSPSQARRWSLIRLRLTLPVVDPLVVDPPAADTHVDDDDIDMHALEDIFRSSYADGGRGG